MIKVKICGITSLEDARFVESAGADALGFIFTKKSPRYINQTDAEKIIANLGLFIAKVGIFMDEDEGRVLEQASSLKLNVLQFHGKESPAYCNFFRPKFKVIKVFFAGKETLARQTARYKHKVDAFMFDVKYEEKIEGKKQLSRQALKEIAAIIKEGKRVIISGGLNTENISAIKELNPYAVDAASGVEKFVGKKDEGLVREFIDKIKR